MTTGKKQRKSGGGDADNFYISWGDLVSLLLVFFVYLFSISEIDYVKFLEATNSMKEEITQVKDELLEKIKLQQSKLQEMNQAITEFIEQEKLQDVLDVQVYDDRLELQMGNVLLFTSGSSNLKNRAEKVLDKIGAVFSSAESKIIVEGHTDDIPIRSGTYPSNWELSSARAASVVRYLGSTGVKENQFIVMGFNQYQPLAPNTSEENRAKNRRVKIILKPDIDAILKRRQARQEKEAASKETSMETQTASERRSG